MVTRPLEARTLDLRKLCLVMGLILSGCATGVSSPHLLASAPGRAVHRSPSMMDGSGEKVWLTGIKHQAEVKFSEATPVKALEALAGNSWTKTSNITDDGVEHSENGLRNDEGTQIMLSFEGAPPLARLDDESSKSAVKFLDDGGVEFKIKDANYDCRSLSRTPASLICRVDRGVLGDKYEIYQRKTFLQK